MWLWTAQYAITVGFVFVPVIIALLPKKWLHDRSPDELSGLVRQLRHVTVAIFGVALIVWSLYTAREMARPGNTLPLHGYVIYVWMPVGMASIALSVAFEIMPLWRKSWRLHMAKASIIGGLMTMLPVPFIPIYYILLRLLNLHSNQAGQ